MALNFPSPATNGQTWTDLTGRQWVYDTGNNSWTAKGGAAGGMVYKGGIDITTAPPAGVQSGWLYAVTTGGTANAGFTGLTGTVPVGSQVVYGGPNWQLLSAPGPWSRTGTELSPATAGDSVFTTGAVKVGGTTAAPNLQIKADGGIVANTDGLVYDAATKNLGIGVPGFGAKLHVVSGSIPSIAQLYIGQGGGSNNYYDANNHYFRDGNLNNVITATSSAIQFYTNNGERGRWDTSGRLLVGTSSTTGVAKLQVQGYVGDDNGLALLALRLGSSSPANGANLGRIDFNDSTDSRGASIGVERDGGTWGASSKPSRLVFSVTADGSSSPVSRIELKNDGTTRFNGAITSYLDNSQSIGTAAFRWTTVYAATDTINTSDENLKQDIEELNAAENAAAITVKSLIKKFRFKDAVIKKGDDARIHVGVIAQEVEQAFVNAGLDPRRYALFCEDELEDGTKLLGIRYDELLAFVIAAL